MTHELPWDPHQRFVMDATVNISMANMEGASTSTSHDNPSFVPPVDGQWLWVPNAVVGGTVRVLFNVTKYALTWEELREGGGARTRHEVPMASIVGAAVIPGPALQIIAYPHVTPTAHCKSSAVTSSSELLHRQMHGHCTPAELEEIKSHGQGSNRERKVYVFHFQPRTSATLGEDARALHTLLEGQAGVISHLAQNITPPSAPSLPPRRRMLVIINPMSGLRRGVQLFRGSSDEELPSGEGLSCAQMLRDSHCDIDEHVTSRAHEATDMLRDMSVERIMSYSGIIGVGGDGILNEILHGVMERRDWRAVVNRVIIGLLPAGSGNGLVCSFLAAAGFAYSLHNACILIAKNVLATMDVASTFVLGSNRGASTAQSSPAVTAATAPLTGHGKGDAGDSSVRRTMSYAPVAETPTTGQWGRRYYQFLSTSWGIISDLDIESEVVRCLGPMRFDVWGLYRSCCLRKYRGRLSFLPANPHQRSGRRWTADAANSPLIGNGNRSRKSSAGAETEGLGAATAAVGADTTVPAPELHYLVPFDHPVPLQWRTIEGLFTLLWITNTTHQGVGIAGAPGSSHNDGVMTITVVRDVSTCRMMSILLGMDNDGSFRNSRGVEVYTCVAFRLEPDVGPDAPDYGHIALDGEDVPYGPVQAEVHASLLRVYGPNTAVSPDDVEIVEQLPGRA